MIYRNKFLKNKNLFFESQCKQNLDYDNNIYTYIIDFSLSFIQLQNSLTRFMKIIKKTRFDIITKFN